MIGKLSNPGFWILLLWLVRPAVAAPPPWFSATQLPNYPQSAYFTAVGAGESFEAAADAARSGIAGQIQVSVHSEFQDYATSLDTESRREYLEITRSLTRSVVDSRLTGVEIVKKSHPEDEEYYVFAVLSRDLFLKNLRVELEAQWQELHDRITAARTAVQEGRATAALEAYRRAQELVPPFQVRKNLYDTFAPVPWQPLEFITPAALDAQVRIFLDALHLELVSGNLQEAAPGEELPEPVVFRIYYQPTGGEPVPVSGFPVEIRRPQLPGDFLREMTSDSRGEIRVRIVAMGNMSGKRQIVCAAGIRNLPVGMRTPLRRLQASALYRLKTVSPIHFRVEIRDQGGTPVPPVAEKIREVLAEWGYVIADDAPLILRGVVRPGEVQEVESPGGTRYLAESHLQLELVERDSQKTLGVFTTTGKGFHPRDREQALDISRRKLKLRKKNLVELLTQARDDLDRLYVIQSRNNLAAARAAFAAGNREQALKLLSEVIFGAAERAAADSLTAVILQSGNK